MFYWSGCQRKKKADLIGREQQGGGNKERGGRLRQGLYIVFGFWDPAREYEHSHNVNDCWHLGSCIMISMCSLWGGGFAFFLHAVVVRERNLARQGQIYSYLGCYPCPRGWEKVSCRDREVESFCLILFGLVGEDSLTPHTGLKNCYAFW